MQHLKMIFFSSALFVAFGCAKNDFAGSSGKHGGTSTGPQLTDGKGGKIGGTNGAKDGDDGSDGNDGIVGANDGNDGDGKGNDASGGDSGSDDEGDGGGSGSSVARDDAVVKKCIAAWGNEKKFPKGAKYKTIDGSKSSLGIVDIVWDHAVTSEPQITLVHSKFGMVGAGLYNLQNPNGWYCLDVEFGEGPLASGVSTVNLTCDAHLVQAHYSGGDFARVATVVRINMLPPMPCLDGKDHLVKIDATSSVLPDVSGTILLHDELEAGQN